MKGKKLPVWLGTDLIERLSDSWLALQLAQKALLVKEHALPEGMGVSRTSADRLRVVNALEDDLARLEEELGEVTPGA